MDAHAIELLETATLYFQDLEQRGDNPDVHEGDVSKLAAPFSGYTYTTQTGVDVVSEELPARETPVG